MAVDMTEVEIKIPLEKGEFSLVREKLGKLAGPGTGSSQADRYFTPAHRDFLGPAIPFEWLRVGKRGGKTILNYKHWHPEGAEVFTHCDEFETVVESPEHLEKLLAALDFKELVTVEKEREVFKVGDEIEVSMDIVKELGHFIEIEALKDFGGVEATREKLFAFARELGLDPSRKDKMGYPRRLMWKRNMLKS